MASCKQNCFKRIMVPYKIVAHQAVDSEENLYRNCLAERFPSVTQEDYVACTKNVYAHRVELLMTHFANSCESVLESIH